MHRDNCYRKPEVIFHGFIATAVFSGLQHGKGRVSGHVDFPDNAYVETGFIQRSGPNWFETKNTFYWNPEPIPREAP